MRAKVFSLVKRVAILLAVCMLTLLAAPLRSSMPSMQSATRVWQNRIGSCDLADDWHYALCGTSRPSGHTPGVFERSVAQRVARVQPV
jgi:hypothetical protein